MSTVLSLPILFDRTIRPSHAWYASYQAMQSAVRDDVQAVYANLAMEHRIATTSLKELENDVAQCLQNQAATACTPDLPSALGTYFSEHYIQPPRNVRFLGDPIQKLPASTSLIHVTSMSKLFKRLLKTGDSIGKLHGVIATYFGRTIDIPQSGKDWKPHHTSTLADNLNVLDRLSFVELMEAVHNLLPANSPCWWAAPYLDLKKQTEQLGLAENIALALGLGYFETDDFLLVYQYKVSEAGQLYTPTTPETNAYAYHFPSPPQSNTSGGLSMPLVNDLKPCSEFIHHPLSAENASRALQQPIRDLQKMIDMSVLSQNLSNLRQHHRQVLDEHHCATQTGQQWMQKYVHLM
jgi:hypothetical protein